MNSIAHSFVRARLAGNSLSEYPGVVPEDADSAYACQDEAIRAWPDRIAGWKVARIAVAWPAGSPEASRETRLVGPVFARNRHHASPAGFPACPVFAGGFAAVEAEIVIVVAADAPPDRLQWSLADALPFIGTIHIGIEIASSPLATLNDLGPGAVISDFGNNWGVVLGPAVVGWDADLRIDCETFIDGRAAGANAVELRTGPLAAFTFALGKCAALGRPLRAGQWVSTGMITGVHGVVPGQQSRHVFHGHGEIGSHLVRAAALATP